jgi:flagellin-like protein
MRIQTRTAKRKAISPVLATVILIAITLIAAIAVAGFVFGLFGSFTSTARVTISAPEIVHGTGVGITGTLIAYNSGTSNANANSATLTYGGNTCAVTITGAPALITAGLAPGTTITVTGTAACLASTAGQSFVGSISLSNGGQVPFSGTFT